MLEYIEEVFGIKAKLEKWDEMKKLPIYLQNKREYYMLTVGEQECLLLKMAVEGFSLPAFQKQVLQLKKYTDKSVVLWFDTISSYQRQALIKNRIPFLVPDSQIYVPAWGIYLREHLQNRVLKVEKMTAIAQYLLLYLIYQSENKSYTQTELAAKLNLSAMNISRSVQELQQLELVSVEREGRFKLVKAVSYGKDLYELAREYMQSPVQKKIYVAYEKAYLDFPVAGEEALALRSMMNPPGHRVCALDKKRKEIISENEIIDPKWVMEDEYMEIEIWKYNPDLFAKNGMVDVISLALSLGEIDDERVEMQIEEMMEEYKW